MKNLSRLLMSLSFCLLSDLAISQDELELQDQIDEAFEELDSRHFNGVAGITLAGHTSVFRKFGGTTGLAPSATEILFDLNSVTKTVTAVAIMKLVESNRLSLDQTLDEFFDAVPDDKQAIDLHNLLTHSAGFRDALGSDEEEIVRQAYVERALGSRLRFQPGSSYSYSNVGYSLLAAIIEITADQSYEDFLKFDLLKQHSHIAMGYSGNYDANYSMQSQRGENIAQASWGGDEAYWHLMGNGGLVTTAEDFLTFLSALNRGEIISADSLRQLHTPHVQEVPDNTYYGYGLVVDNSAEAGDYYWHNGGNGSFSAIWIDYVDHDLLIFAAATGRLDADSAAGIIADAFIAN